MFLRVRYKGEITRVRRDGTYDIRYEDNDTERGVRAELIRKVGGGGGGGSEDEQDETIREGDAVEARFGGKNKW